MSGNFKKITPLPGSGERWSFGSLASLPGAEVLVSPDCPDEVVDRSIEVYQSQHSGILDYSQMGTGSYGQVYSDEHERFAYKVFENPDSPDSSLSSFLANYALRYGLDQMTGSERTLRSKTGTAMFSAAKRLCAIVPSSSQAGAMGPVWAKELAPGRPFDKNNDRLPYHWDREGLYTQAMDLTGIDYDTAEVHFDDYPDNLIDTTANGVSGGNLTIAKIDIRAKRNFIESRYLRQLA